MNMTHLHWCLQHDWGQTAELKSGAIYLYEDEYRNTLINPLVFDSFEKLKAWAGY